MRRAERNCVGRRVQSTRSPEVAKTTANGSFPRRGKRSERLVFVKQFQDTACGAKRGDPGATRESAAYEVSRKQFQDGERSERRPEVAKTIVNGNEVK